MSTNRSIIFRGLVVVGYGLTSNCLADAQNPFGTFQLHGFVAQSFIQTTDNDFFGNSENGSWEFRELGINGLWRPTNGLQLALQLVGRDAGKTDDGDVRIDYGFIDYTLFSSDLRNTGLRVGRVVNPYGFYNDTRDIAATRPSILLPQSIYFDVNRNFALSSDGVQYYHEYSGRSGDYFFQFGVFEPRMEDPDFEPAIFFRDVPGELAGTTSWMGRLIYEYDFGRIRLGITASEVNVDYEPERADAVLPGEFLFRPYIASLQYNQENWSLTAEYARRTTRLEKFGPPLDVEFTGHSYFVQGIYRLNTRWELLLRYDELVWNNDDSNGRDFQAQTGLPNHARFARDWTIGACWDFNQHLMLRAEWHKVDGTGWLSMLENPSPRATEQHWDLFAFSVSFRF